MSNIVLHNGNCLVKPWATKFYNAKSMQCLTDDWPNLTNLYEKCQYASQHKLCTDLTVADQIDIKDLYHAKKTFKIVKVVTSFQHDLNNLEEIWKFGYDETQWLESIFSRLSLTDQIIFWETTLLPSTQSESAIVFTPGRCGTHVLMGIANVSEFLHHNDHILHRSEFLRLVNAEKILSVLRKSFADQVLSDAISNTHGLILTTPKNLKTTLKQVNKWKSFEVTRAHFQSTLEKIVSYTDLLLGLKIFYNKHIEFSLFENLQIHSARSMYIKNPYTYQTLISNYDQAIEVCNQEYQPIYNQIITKLQNTLGTNLYNHV